VQSVPSIKLKENPCPLHQLQTLITHFGLFSSCSSHFIIPNQNLQLLLDSVSGLLSFLTCSVGGIGRTLLDSIGSFLALLRSLLLTCSCSRAKLIPNPLGTVGELSPESTLWSSGAILEVVALVASVCNQLVLGCALWDIEAV